jgi:hypothetical protein
MIETLKADFIYLNNADNKLLPLLKCDAAHEIKSTNKTFSELVR